MSGGERLAMIVVGGVSSAAMMFFLFHVGGVSGNPWPPAIVAAAVSSALVALATWRRR